MARWQVSLFLGVLGLTLTAGMGLADSDESRALSRPQADRPFRIRVYWENDGTILKPNNTQDRHYTNGNAMTFSHQPDWAKRLADAAEPIALDGAFNHTQSAAGYVLGHQMFTPRNITVEKLIEDDRPYAGYLYGGGYWQRANDTTFDHLELNLGVVGPAALGEQIQSIIHDMVDDRDPRGWDNQLDNEPTIQAFLRRQWRWPLHALWTDAETSGFGVEFLPKAELAVGTVHRYVEGAMMLRAGFNLPDDFGPGEIQNLPAATGLSAQGPGRFGAYGFVGAAGRIVEHNLFLAGNTFESSHGVEEETLFGRLRAGVAMQYRGRRWDLNAIFSQSFLTPEFKQQDDGDAFGQLMLSLTRRF